MSFKLAAPGGGQPATEAIVRYSGAIYNSWEYDTGLGKYLRFSETADDNNNQNEQYARLTDRLTNQPIAFDNVVVLYVNHELYSPGIYDILLLSGSGDSGCLQGWTGLSSEVAAKRHGCGLPDQSGWLSLRL